MIRKKHKTFLSVCIVLLAALQFVYPSSLFTQEKKDVREDAFADPFEEPFEEDPSDIADPLEPLNRLTFSLNDSFYVYLFNPVSKGYGRAVPEGLRQGIKNFFSNLSSPVRLANCLMQRKFKKSGIECKRLFINSTLGVGGFFDVADTDWGYSLQDEDFGKTLAHYGVGDGWYIVLPFIGPRNTRDTVGLAGDIMLRMTYTEDLGNLMEIKALEYVNENSFEAERYERLKEGLIDPYVGFRNAYVQYRNKKLQE
ncbi:MAG: VacJ family lipoprotein [Candidatus Aureabacteria bacterium]|nr:VacJ family lipoprotein [Candidatus Auribacterota bacterium]